MEILIFISCHLVCMQFKMQKMPEQSQIDLCLGPVVLLVWDPRQEAQNKFQGRHCFFGSKESLRRSEVPACFGCFIFFAALL